MYVSHYGLKHRPFRATPDSDCYYPATSHERALGQLLQAVASDEGLALLTGAPGTGKTLLCHCLLERLGPEVRSAFLTNGHLAGRTGLLQAVLYDLSLPYEGRTEQELRLRLTDFLLENYAAGKRMVLIVDEAQHLDVDLLEELRLLANLEARQARAIQVVLAGQPALVETLRRPELRVLSQRLAVRACLRPLPVEEAADYLLHQLRTAGGRPEDVLSDEALEILARGAQGVPRLLNQAAHQALALAYAAGSVSVDAEAALEALAVLGLQKDQESEATSFPPAPDLGAGSGDSQAEAPAGETATLRLDPGEEQLAGPVKVTQGGDDGSCAYRLFGAPRRPA
jgi:type II secretory pathway predicted ATPase ExeA